MATASSATFWRFPRSTSMVHKRPYWQVFGSHCKRGFSFGFILPFIGMNLSLNATAPMHDGRETSLWIGWKKQPMLQDGGLFFAKNKTLVFNRYYAD